MLPLDDTVRRPARQCRSGAQLLPGGGCFKSNEYDAGFQTQPEPLHALTQLLGSMIVADFRSPEHRSFAAVY